MSTEQTIHPDYSDSAAQLCMKRLSRKLSEVEIVMTTQEGKANQMRKERDAERAENEQLKKEIIKLNNQLLKERMMISASIKRNITKQQDETVTDGKQESGRTQLIIRWAFLGKENYLQCELVNTSQL